MSKDVLFLGAGFSAQFGLPTMGEFFDHPTTHEALTPAEIEWLMGLQRGARDVVGMLQGPHDNLEHVLSVALMDYARLRTSKPEETRLYERIVQLLYKVYRRIDHRKFEGAAEALKWLFAFTADSWDDFEIGPDLTIITTNYDLCAEHALALWGAPAVLPIKWSSIQSESRFAVAGQLYRLPGASGPMLCKLHGSVNWISKPYAEGDINVESRMLSGHRFTRELADMQTIRYPMVSAHDVPEYKEGVAPLLVPPMFFKHQVDPRLDASWEAAAAALDQAKRVAFVGYSFPPSDSHMRYFIGTALTRNVRLKKIFIVDPRAKAIVESLSSPEFGPHFRSMLSAQPYPWFPQGGYRLV